MPPVVPFPNCPFSTLLLAVSDVQGSAQSPEAQAAEPGKPEPEFQFQKGIEEGVWGIVKIVRMRMASGWSGFNR